MIILSHIEIISPGNNYIYGATIKWDIFNIAETSIDSNNRIKKIKFIIEKRIEIGEEPLIIIDGSPDRL